MRDGLDVRGSKRWRRYAEQLPTACSKGNSSLHRSSVDCGGCLAFKEKWVAVQLLGAFRKGCDAPCIRGENVGMWHNGVTGTFVPADGNRSPQPFPPPPRLRHLFCSHRNSAALLWVGDLDPLGGLVLAAAGAAGTKLFPRLWKLNSLHLDIYRYIDIDIYIDIYIYIFFPNTSAPVLWPLQTGRSHRLPVSGTVLISVMKY